MKDQKLTMPISFEKLSRIYKDHKRDRFIPEFHKTYFKTNQIKDTIPLVFLFFGLAFYFYYSIGLFLIISEFDTLHFPGSILNLIVQIYCFAYYVLVFAISKYVAHVDKWNWVKSSTFWTIFFVIILSVLFFRFINVYFPQWSSLGVEPNIFHYSIMISGIVWGPTLIFFFAGYVGQNFITEFGRIHLCLGWIYYLANKSTETSEYVDFRFLTKTFKRLISELENWLKKTYRLIFQNKDEIEANFFSNLINEKSFLSFYSDKDKKNIFEEILINKSPQSELSFHIIQDAIELVKKISTKQKIGFRIYSGSQKVVAFISGFKTQLISLVIILINSLLGLSLTI